MANTGIKKIKICLNVLKKIRFAELMVIGEPWKYVEVCTYGKF